MWQPDASPVEARERGLQRLRAWTTASAVLAAGLALVFALLAAGTFPGRTASASDNSSGASNQAPGDQTQQRSSFGDQGFPQAQPQPPGGGFFGSGSGTGGQRGARSGGS
ncbi:MAG TPA: hypothetical protein VOB72_12000 [Candidatus Dormibacteraeota bacterium]|nr:hypothetical protein [Candidatus Dormibacteraeota bacterium]